MIISEPNPSNKLKLSALISKKIECDIVESGWQPGLIFATEADMVKRYSVSRAVLREAISQVERKGIAKMRRGHGGGLVISESARTATIHALSTYMELANTDLGEMFEIRRILDKLSANLACKNITESQANFLSSQAARLNEVEHDSEQAAQLNLSIRREIAAASGNPLVSLFSDAIDDSSADIAIHQFGELYIFKQFRNKTARIKQKLCKAIIDADIHTAQALAMSNVDTQMRYYKSLLQNTRAKLHSNGNNTTALTPTSIKLGHSIALKISHSIQVDHLPEGTRLGSEPELMKKFNVSRAAFREAVRLLEDCSIVCARRGNGGGLIVGRPNPYNAIESIITYMGIMKLPLEALLIVKETLELISVKLAAKRLTTNHRQAIEAAITLSQNSQSFDDSLQKTIAVNQSINNASNNKTLALLLQTTLKCLAKNHIKTPISKKLIHDIQINQQQVAKAIFEGKSGLATRHMIKQLQITNVFLTV